MDYELERQLTVLMQASTMMQPTLHGLAQMVVFRECWSTADPATKAAFADSFLARTLEAILRGEADRELSRLATGRLGNAALFETEHGASALSHALVARAVRLVDGSSDYNDLIVALQKIAKGAVDKVAAENAPAIEAKLRDAVTNAMLDDAVRVAANAMSHELRRRVEEAAAAKALTAGEAT
jgi:hypothetical protein